MTAQVSQALSQTATTPVPLTPAATDTFTEAQFGARGILLTITTTGTATTATVLDPATNTTPLGNPGAPVGQVMPATGVRDVVMTRAAINTVTGIASVTFSGALTGVTYTAKQI